MDTIASLIALAIVCLVIVTPSVVVGNCISKKIDSKSKE